MTEPIPFLDRLGDQLRHASPATPERRTGVLLRVAAAGVVVALAAVAFGAWRSQPVAAGVDVRRSGNHVVLRVFGTAPPASEIQEIAHRNGLGIDVVEIPVGPSNVGQMFPGELRPPDVDFTGGAVDGTRTITFPVNWKGHLDVQIGRPARPGETYERTSDALAPGEPLACMAGATAAAARRLAERRGLVVRWWLTDPSTLLLRHEVPSTEAAAAAGYRVAYGVALDAHHVIVELTPDGRPSPPRPIRRYRSC